MKSADRVPSESVGSGEYRILRGNVVGGELVSQDRLVHLSAFPAEDRVGSRDDGHQAGQSGAGPIARPSQRKRRF